MLISLHLHLHFDEDPTLIGDITKIVYINVRRLSLYELTFEVKAKPKLLTFPYLHIALHVCEWKLVFDVLCWLEL